MNNRFVFALIAVVAFAFDRLCKAWVNANIEIGSETEVVAGFLYLTHVRNPGALLGALGEISPHLRVGLFSGIAVAVSLLVMLMLRGLAPRDRRSATSLALVFAGAVGNATDRFLYDASVLDFLQLRLWRAERWPDFNLADAFILFGVASLLIDVLATERKPSVLRG